MLTHFCQLEGSFKKLTANLEEKNALLKSELTTLKSPPIPPENMKIVREGWEKLKPYERDGVRLLLTHGDMVDRIARNQLKLTNLGNLFPHIEEQTNFVQRTSQSYNQSMVFTGYEGTWTINPHLKSAIIQFLASIPEGI